jgi:hypothetical protein
MHLDPVIRRDNLAKSCRQYFAVAVNGYGRHDLLTLSLYRQFREKTL